MVLPKPSVSPASNPDYDQYYDRLNASLYASVSTSPGQSGTADGYLLEAKELEFYHKKLQKKGKNNKQ